eukprot:SAG11_NODE_9747_length_883_cov_1.443878_1_plen_71_part_00
MVFLKTKQNWPRILRYAQSITSYKARALLHVPRYRTVLVDLLYIYDPKLSLCLKNYPRVTRRVAVGDGAI